MKSYAFASVHILEYLTNCSFRDNYFLFSENSFLQYSLHLEIRLSRQPFSTASATRYLSFICDLADNVIFCAVSPFRAQRCSKEHIVDLSILADISVTLANRQWLRASRRIHLASDSDVPLSSTPAPRCLSADFIQVADVQSRRRRRSSSSSGLNSIRSAIATRK